MSLMCCEVLMNRFKSSFLLTILFLMLFRAVFPYGNSTVLCFSEDGHVVLREAHHSLCEKFHHDIRFSELKFHDHDHCSDIEIPSLSAKIDSVKISDHFVYEPTSYLSFILRFRNTFFENIPKVESKADHGRQKRLNIISKTVLLC